MSEIHDKRIGNSDWLDIGEGTWRELAHVPTGAEGYIVVAQHRNCTRIAKQWVPTRAIAIDLAELYRQIPGCRWVRISRITSYKEFMDDPD